jgi:protein SCO1/2
MRVFRISGRLEFVFALALLSWGVSDRLRSLAGDSPQAKAPRAAYFPKITLRTQDGKEVLFYEDLLKGKIVVINLMYSRCDGQLCGEGTKNLVKLQNALGDHFGREVFMYSITLDPEHDTPDVLKDYAKMYGARWTFLTATAEDNTKKVEDITSLRRKLGLFNSDPKVDADRKKHTGMIVIGNVVLDKWNRTSVLSSPDRILQMIERLKPPAPPQK